MRRARVGSGEEWLWVTSPPTPPSELPRPSSCTWIGLPLPSRSIDLTRPSISAAEGAGLGSALLTARLSGWGWGWEIGRAHV